MIGDDIEVFVVSVRGDTVRIGIEAPCSTGVFRKEVYLEIESAREEASEDQPLGHRLDAGRHPVDDRLDAGRSQGPS